MTTNMEPREEGLQDRLERIERMSKEMHRALVRLEWRLEQAGILPGVKNVTDGDLYASEHGIQEPPSKTVGYISRDDVERVVEWLEKHRGENNITFADMEKDFGQEDRFLLTDVLTYLRLDGAFEAEIESLVSGNAPSHAKGVMRDPFAAWRGKKKRS
jgi:hypothetical protein